MHVNDISRQQFSKIASRGLKSRMSLTEREFVPGAGTLVAKFNGKGCLVEGEDERAPARLTIACGAPRAVLGGFRRRQDTGNAAPNVSPRFIRRRSDCRTSAKTPPIASLARSRSTRALLRHY